MIEVTKSRLNFYKGTGRDPDADTRQMVRPSDIYYNPRGMQENGCVQAKYHKQGQSPGGIEWQAGPRSGQAVWSGRRVQSQGRQGSKPG